MEKEGFSEFPDNMRKWIGDNPARILNVIKGSANATGVGAGRCGGPIMEEKYRSRNLLREKGAAFIPKGPGRSSSPDESKLRLEDQSRERLANGSLFPDIYTQGKMIFACRAFGR